MRIYKRGKERWYVDYFFGAERIRLKAGSSEQAAKSLRLRIETELAAGSHDPAKLRLSLAGIAPEQATFKTLRDEFLANYHAQTDYYRDVTIALAEHFDAKPIGTITPTSLDDYLDKRRAIHTKNKVRRISESTLRKEVNVLLKILRWGKPRGYVPSAVFDAFEHYSRPSDSTDSEIAVVPIESEAAMLGALTPIEQDVVEWAIYSGMRQGEILALRFPQVDQAKGLIHVLPRPGSGKTGKRRVVPLDISLRLRAILGRRPRHIGSDLVFCGRDGSPLDRFELDRAVEAAEKAANIPRAKGVKFNRFRHTFATRLANSGRVSIFEIAKWMGNTVAVCEKHYAAYLPGEVQRASGLLDAVERRVPPSPARMDAPGAVRRRRGTVVAPSAAQIA